MFIDPLAHLTQWNPLRGLTPAALLARLEEGERGDYARLQWTYRAVERRNPTARALKAKFTGALRLLDWRIQTRAGLPASAAAEASAQARTLRAAYERVGNLRAAIVHLALAYFHGYAHCNKVYAGAAPSSARQPSPPLDPWSVVELRCAPPWHFSRQGSAGPWTYDPAARFGSAVGAPLEPRDWVVHEVEDPVSEILAACHVQSVAADAAWEAFLDTYSSPAIFILGPPNVPREREPEYQAVARAIVAEGRGYLPHGSAVENVAAPRGQSDVFAQRLAYLQRLMVLAGTGGLLSMLAEPTGIGKGATDAHDDTWLAIAGGVAAAVSETLQAQFDLPELQRIHGPAVEPLAYFELARPDKEDVAALAATVRQFSAAGYVFDPVELSERTGCTLRVKDSPAAAPAPPAGDPPQLAHS